MKNKLLKFFEFILLLIIILVCIFSIFDSSILDNKICFILLLIVPFLLLFTIELIKIIKDIKMKTTNELNIEDIDIEELKNIKDKIEVQETIENTINKHIEEKIDKEEQDKTIQIPVKEIKTEIEKLNKKLTQEENDLDKTEVLFSKDDIKEIIKKELESTTSVDKSKKNSKKSTVSVEKSKEKNKKSTKTVDK